MICGSIGREGGNCFISEEADNEYINIHNIYKTNIKLSSDVNKHGVLIHEGIKYACVLCGELYNRNELLSLIKKECRCNIDLNISDSLLLIWMYIFYGMYSPKYINGKFAYIIYSEAVTPKMFLAVDRFGFRSIYYREDRNNFCFSSSFERMLKAGKSTLSYNGIGNIFYLDGNTFDDFTVIDEIKKIPSGECACIDCREEIKMIRKSYVHYNKNTDSSIQSKEMLLNTYQDITALTEVTDCINIPDTLDIYKAFSNYKGDDNVYSNIGAVLFQVPCLGRSRGYFPWVIDPYESISILDRSRINMTYAFDGINKKRQKYADPDSRTYFLDSAVKLYLPMKIRKTEMISGSFNINIKYPLCDVNCIRHIYTSENCNISDLKAFKYNNKNHKYIESFTKKLIQLSNSESSIVNYISKEEIIKENMGNIKAIKKLYMTHIFIQKYSLDLDI